MPDDRQAPMDAEPLWSLPDFGSDLPEPLEKGIVTAVVALVLSIVAFLIVDGSGPLVALVVGFLYSTAVFTTVYALASS